ncbi:MAG: hypothetical protein ACRDKI_01665 [Solirubrobacterales bacterium]
MNKATNKRSPSRSGRAWSGADVSRLIVMAERQIPATRIAAKLRRSEGAVRAEAARQRVLLAPADRAPTAKPPYGGISARTVRARTAPSGRAQQPSRGPASQQETLF